MEKHFENIYPFEEKNYSDLLKWRLERNSNERKKPDPISFPLAENDPDFLRSNKTLTTLTWIGHSTVLLQMGGKNILTDPHFSERASPVQWTGPRRHTPPGLSLDDLPLIHFILISHNHYDHLDRNSIKRLLARDGGRETLFLVPLGLKKWFLDQGAFKVIELDWWEEGMNDGFTFTAVPSRHWSKRHLFRNNDSLWANWVVSSNGFRFLFVGDSGYSPIYKDIGDKMGPFDLAILPIGAYEPRWFMKDQHVSPDEAVMIHQDVGSKRSIASHWGAFVLSDEPLDEPPERLSISLKERNIPESEFSVLKQGETIMIDKTGQ